MSEGQQESYQHENPSSVVNPQNPQQLPQAQVSHDPSASGQPQLSSHKRKRDSVDNNGNGEVDDGRSGAEGSPAARRSSFKQASPNMPAAFMPINPNSPGPNTQYAYQPMTVSHQQHSSPSAVNGSSASDAANAALAANAMSSMLPTLGPGMGYGAGPDVKSGEQHGQMEGGFPAMSPQPAEGHHEGAGGAAATPTHLPPRKAAQPTPKPQVGTDEWHRVRRDNHKEVERRRRETINEGINELAKIVPGCEKNKGSILQRAVQYIQQLKENETQNIEKWTLEKLLTEQAIQELSQRNEKLQKDHERAMREAEAWKKTCQQAGITREGGAAGGSS